MFFKSQTDKLLCRVLPLQTPHYKHGALIKKPPAHRDNETIAKFKTNSSWQPCPGLWQKIEVLCFVSQAQARVNIHLAQPSVCRYCLSAGLLRTVNAAGITDHTWQCGVRLRLARMKGDF